MKTKFLQITLLLALAMIFSPVAYSVSFVQHVDSEGRLITSNLPESCVVDGVLVCYEYYNVLNSGPIPVYRESLPNKASPVKPAAQQSSSSTSPEPEVVSE
jgi:hypothetical protein